MAEYIFIIYSCKKNLEKANKIYEKINNQIDNTKIYIIYGEKLNENENENANHKIMDDKYIILNVNDDYDHLNEKTLLLIKTINLVFPTIKGMFKCDDDVIHNVKHINTFLKNIPFKNIDYCGKKNVRTKEYNEWSKKKGFDKYPSYECSYCGGPFYFLSKKAMDCFHETKKPKNIYYEDMMVGYHLNQFNIFPVDGIDLYSDNIYDSNQISYHNKKHNEKLYMIIQGGLGNQLFQLACAMKMAEKYNKKFVLNIAGIIPNPHQKNNINTTINTIHLLFPDLPICNEKVLRQEFYNYKEDSNECFQYNEKKMDDCFNVYNNIVLDGYFINYKYIPLPIFEKIKLLPFDQRLLAMNFTNVYFIHIRLGDYLKHKMYQLNLKPYYNYCINQILKLNADATFIICTNQYDDKLQNYLKDFPKNMKYEIQDSSHTDIDTLYIMSSCCGAICSNSTLSFMGALLQKTSSLKIKNKDNIYMPYPFVNFVDEFNPSNVSVDMYPEWCSIYNTLNSSIL